MKKRIDLLVAQRLSISRSKAQRLIEEGCVFVDDIQVLKTSLMFEDDCLLKFAEKKSYVSRGAYKLIGAIEKFDLDFKNLIVIDLGSSTGGFTEVALEKGAKKIYAVDIGRDELDKTLTSNERVVSLQGRDVRSLTRDEVGDAQIVIGDLSFISLKHILPKINELFGKIECVLLFKPQFECGKEIAKKYKGVIKDKLVHQNLLNEFVRELQLYEFQLSNLTFSPVKGKGGNIEYLIHLNGKNKRNICVNDIVNSAFFLL